jgi:hypothetical protein
MSGDFTCLLTAEEVDLVLAYRRARAEHGVAMTIEDAIAGIEWPFWERLQASWEAVEAELQELTGTSRPARSVVAACESYLAAVGEASLLEMRDGLGGWWHPEELGCAMLSFPRIFERLPGWPNCGGERWRLREVAE